MTFITYRANYFLVSLLVAFFIIGVSHESKAQNYLDTREKLDSFFIYYNNFRDSILKLPEEGYNNGAVALFCESITKVNHKLYDQDYYVIVDHMFEKPDSVLYQAVLEFHEPLAYLIENRRPIERGLEETCAADYYLFKKLDREWAAIGMTLLMNIKKEDRERNRQKRNHVKGFEKFIESMDREFDNIKSDNDLLDSEWNGKDWIVTGHEKYDKRVGKFICKYLNQIDLESLAQDPTVIDKKLLNPVEWSDYKDFYRKESNKLTYTNGIEEGMCQLMRKSYNEEERAKVTEIIGEKCPESAALRLKANSNLDFFSKL